MTATPWVEAGNAWYPYVTVMKNLGFTRVSIIARANYSTLACTTQQCVATLWEDTDTDGAVTKINENQQLLDDWTVLTKRIFGFYGKKFNIVLRDSNDAGHNFLVCAKGNDICLAAQFTTIWVVVFGQKQKPDLSGGKKKKKGKAAKEPGFAGAQGAYNTIMKDSWDALVEAGV